MTKQESLAKGVPLEDISDNKGSKNIFEEAINDTSINLEASSLEGGNNKDNNMHPKATPKSNL